MNCSAGLPRHDPRPGQFDVTFPVSAFGTVAFIRIASRSEHPDIAFLRESATACECSHGIGPPRRLVDSSDTPRVRTGETG